MDSFEEVLEAVGPRLRRLRTERKTTLAQLSESTGISVSTLSRLESGQRRPTLELLLPLARAHQVQLDELVDAPPTGDPRIHAKPIKHHGVVHIPLHVRYFYIFTTYIQFFFPQIVHTYLFLDIFFVEFAGI